MIIWMIQQNKRADWNKGWTHFVYRSGNHNECCIFIERVWNHRGIESADEIAWLAGKTNCLKLIPAEFKISDADVEKASLIRFCNQEDDTVENINVFFFPEGRVMAVKARVPYLYRIDIHECREFFQKCDRYVEEANRKNPGKMCGFGFYLNIPDELKA